MTYSIIAIGLLLIAVQANVQDRIQKLAGL